MIIPVNLGENSYNITLERGALKKAGEIFDLERHALIITDSGVPREYAETVARRAKRADIVTFDQGEKSKNFDTLRTLLRALTENGFTRSDCVVAVGGGVVGDIAGFAASMFMRGIDFYNIPTTLLSQVDSSIGGKTAVDFEGYKNIIGAFKQPKGVIIDPDVLGTLPRRQLSNGLSESIKMALTSDRELYTAIRDGNAFEDIDNVIYRSLLIKKNVVEQDERETGLRRILNFGHTVGHAVESKCGLTELYHGECVAIGMMPMLSPCMREEVASVLAKYDLPSKSPVPAEKLSEAMSHDKKVDGNFINAVFVPEAGKFEIKKLKFEDFANLIKETL